MIAKFFVGGLAPETTEDDMRQHFEQFGELVDVAVMRDAMGIPRCFGFVQYADAHTHGCVPGADHIICNKKVDVKAAVPKEAIDQGVPVRTNKIFVGGLSKASTQDSITAHFSQFGIVTEVLMKFDEMGQSRGFCFVEFDNENSADTACATLPQFIDDKQVECKLARPLGDRSLGKGKGKGFGFGGFGKGFGKGGPMRVDYFGGKGLRPSPYARGLAPAPAYGGYSAPVGGYGRGVVRAVGGFGGRGGYAAPAPTASYGGYSSYAAPQASSAYAPAPAYHAPAYSAPAPAPAYGGYGGYAQGY